MPGKDPGGCIITVLLGIAGSMLGGFIASRLGHGGHDKFSVVGLVITVVGAMLLLWIYWVVMKCTFEGKPTQS